MPKTCILGEQLYLTPLDIYWYLGFRMMLRFAQIAKVWQWTLEWEALPSNLSLFNWKQPPIVSPREIKE